MTLDTTSAPNLRAALADQLSTGGALSDPSWREVVRNVPRHEFVPEFYRQGPSGVWETVTRETPGYLEDVYANVSLTTQLTDGKPTSSSSQPGLMLDMLEALEVAEGMRVLEIATGTGYNCALLSERLGSHNVVSVEVDPHLVELAQQRLAVCGYSPTVVAGDGRKGYPAGARVDRLIATVGMDGIPAAWLSQVEPGGLILTPLGWGNLRLVVAANGTAMGRFLPDGSYFMHVRDTGGSGAVPYPGRPEVLSNRPAIVDPSMTGEDAFTFLLSLMLPQVEIVSETEDGKIIAAQLWAADGSWARVETGNATQGGPRRLWDAVERAYALYEEYGKPQRERYGVTATPDGHEVWIDEPGRQITA